MNFHDLPAWIPVLLTVVAFLAAFPRLRSAGVSKQTIEDLKEANAALRERMNATEETARRAVREAQECKVESARWKARYEEAQRYSAPEAVAHFDNELREHSSQVAERHKLMIHDLEAISTLVMHSLAISTAVAKKLGVDISPLPDPPKFPYEEAQHEPLEP